nr:unnamed protein product [Digitaria exilis]
MTTPRRRLRRRTLSRLEDPAPPQEPSPPFLNQKLLEDIFLHLSSPADLARTTAACRSFRRVITDPLFLRRYRSLHPPLLLGIFSEGIQPATAPHPNAPAARSLANHAGFSFNYIPGGTWHLCHVSDGRVLLERLIHDEDSSLIPDLAVADPVHRCFRLLPPIPEELINDAQPQHNHTSLWEAFLVPSGNQEETSFKVIGRTHNDNKIVVFVFSSDSNLWSVGASTSCAELGLTVPSRMFILGWPQYERGCFYWKEMYRNKLIRLDMSRMEFSTVNLPPGDNNGREFVIVEVGDGMLGLFCLPRDGTTMYYFTRMQNDGEGTDEWLLENNTPLPCKCNIVGVFEGHIFLLGVEKARGRVEAVCFSLEIKTLKIERVNSIDYLYVHIHAYFGYPPFLSARRIEVVL